MIALKDSLDSDFVERIRAIFAPDGLLARARNFEYRPQQQEMAAAGRADAGRGAPSRRRSRHRCRQIASPISCPRRFSPFEKKKKAIISTHTINLQEQLLHKDIPIVKKILPVEFEAALMKGRQNYLCPRRLQRAIQSAERTLQYHRTGGPGAAGGLGAHDNGWDAERSVPRTGSESLDAGLQRSAHLYGEDLRAKPALFLPTGAKAIARGEVVVINHTLLFMLLGSPEEQEEREEGYLFPNDFLIFDEAHTIEQTASRQIGIGISQYGLRATIQRLYNARSKKGLFTCDARRRRGDARGIAR
jgi:ATP-dependent DNA helicase DinG